MASVLQVVELYKRDLEVFAHKQLPRFYMPHSFYERADSSLLLLVRQCPYIHTLVRFVYFVDNLVVYICVVFDEFI